MPSSFSKFAREDPTGKDEPGAKDAYALMTVREKLPKFNPVSCFALIDHA